MLKTFLLCLSFLSLTLAEKFRFDNYSLYKVLPKNVTQVKWIEELQNAEDMFDFWSEPQSHAEYVSILSSPENKSYLESFLKTRGINFEITLPNIQEVIDKETVKKYTRTNTRSMTWDAYYPLEDIYAWIDDLVATHSSVARRIIKGIKISHGSGRKIIFIESAIHSREWITPAVTNYIINELLTSEDEDTKAAARDFDWYIFPVTNPDGYVWTHTEYRLWRKNRRPFGADIGVDLNRNWNNNWLGVGSSGNASTNTYAGPGPFSEEETRTLSEYISSLADKIDLYLSMHSSGQLLLIPFGNTTEPLANYYDAIKIGRRAMGALSVRYGTPYTTGNIAEAIYLATGTSIDWVKEAHQVPLVYCYELRDRGVFGHVLPADQILPSGEETMDSILEMIHQARRLGYMNSGNGLKASILSLAFIFVNFYLH
ncbi:hypothetical protein ABMA27_007276 [Loxostege sticticalis]|uniref:Peptidase M14 domain-containing protein n=1 Tax=Loxostege sticticalis TaxID=481309 RepID=A0ABR3HEZ4_LOXSC